eukprot:TRINITY_DN2472_c0_g1_i3.p1 TRINITY_DN2472_c0_g1~~TRINITY_DN2472_c0_g1_i3.p1  ORF type:complete len:165 (-),score=60.60 TRINITY_DN2472_c0_g1_i3:128-622(-)
MASKYRQSILLRPRKVGSHINDENLNAEYDKEVARHEAQSRRLQDVEAGMMKQIFPSVDEKRELQEAARADMDMQLQIKEELKKQTLIDELEHAEALQQHVQLTQYVEADHKTARREYLSHLMEQNKKLVDYRSQVKTQEKKAEIVEDRARPDYHQMTWNRSTR